jgi:hypothetical protein
MYKKTQKLFARITIALAMVFIAGCAPVANIQVLQPARITIPPHIKRIGIINNSRPLNQNVLSSVLEGVLTGESIGADQIGAENAISGVHQSLTNTQRYVVSMPSVRLPNNGAIDQSLVHEICKTHAVDGLVVLDFFDSNCNVNTIEVVDKIKNKDGTTLNRVSYSSNAILHVITNWKIYDDSTKNIVDQYVNENSRNFNGVGATPQLSAAALPPKRSAINEAGYNAGLIYGNRISPYWISVSRQLFRKGNDPMIKAAKMIHNNQWNKAVEIWKKEIETSINIKIKSKCSYNMAVACEREGNLQLALNYLNNADTFYPIREVSEYRRKIENRIKNNNLLNYQMGN